MTRELRSPGKPTSLLFPWVILMITPLQPAHVPETLVV